MIAKNLLVLSSLASFYHGTPHSKVVRLSQNAKFMPRSFSQRLAILGFSVAIAGGLLLAPPASASDSSPWEHSGAAGLSFTSGNSDSLAYNLRFLGTYRTLENDAAYGVDYFYSEDSGITNNESFRLFGNYNQLLGEKFFFGLNGSLFTNEPSLVDYRVDVGPVLGYYFMRNKKGLLSVEAGFGYAFESKDGESDSFATLRLAQHYDYRWNEVTRIRQSTSLTPKANDAASYIFEFSAGLDLRMNNRWNIQPRVTHRVDLDPAIGQGKSDTLITVGLAYSLNGFLKEEIDRDDERKTLREKDLKTEGNRKGWVRNAGLGASSSSGNTNTLNLNLNYEAIYRSDERDINLKGDYRFAEANNDTTQNRLNLSASHSWKLNKATYAGIGTNFSYDTSNDLDYRITPAVHAGTHPILTDYGGLALEAGLGFTFERQGSVNTNEASFHLTQRLYWQLSYHTYVTQEITYQAFVNDPTTFNLSSYLFVDTFLTENLSWRVGVQFFYDSEPPTGAESDDFSLISGISVRF